MAGGAAEWPGTVLLLLSHTILAGATPGPAPGVVSGLLTGFSHGSTLATVPTLPPLPAIPISSYRSTTGTASQSLVNLMMEKLDTLDERLRQQTSTLWEIRVRMDNLERRLGDLDSKADRQDRRLSELDATAASRVDKLKEALAAHDHKDSAAKEQLGRKVENVYERVVYMENNSITKVQSTTKAILDKASSAHKELQRIVDQSLGLAKAEMATGLDARLGAALVQLNATRDFILNASRATAPPPQDDSDETDAGQRACLDAAETSTKNIKLHVDAKTDHMSSKVSSLYNDMWRRVNTLETMIKSIISLSNATRRDVQSLNVAALGAQHSQQHGRGHHTRQSLPEQGNLEYALNMHEDSVGRQLSALRDSLLDELHGVQQVQDAFLRTCSVSVEEKLTRVLTHHTEFLLEHRSALADLKRQLKTHSTTAGRAASNVTDGTKRLEGAVRGLAEQGRIDSRRIEEALSRLENMTAAIQNASEHVSACSVSLGPAEDEATWSELLQLNASFALPPTEPNVATEPPPTSTPRGSPLLTSALTSSSAPAPPAASATAAIPSTTTDSGKLVLVDSNGLQRLPRREQVGAQGQLLSHDTERGQGQDSNGLQRQRSGSQDSTDSSQDSVTDLSSVDEEDNTEEYDDETDLVD